MTEKEIEKYDSDVRFMLSENKTYVRQMICKTVGLVIIPFTAWLLLAFIDFT